ncbi:MAG: T9SS type A sorting domain-containing protein [Polaribacter sp.]
MQVAGVSKSKNYEIINALGQKISKGKIPENEKIEIKNLANGLYFLKFKNGNTLKFVKE